MRVFVIESGQRIAPFGDLARDLPIAGVPLHEWQRALFLRFGLEVVPLPSLAALPNLDEPCLLTFDDVMFTRRVLKSFLQRWRAAGHQKKVQVALPASSAFIECFSALQDLERDDVAARFRLYGLPSGASDLNGAEALVVAFKEIVVRPAVPPQVTGTDHWTHPVTSSVCFHIRHWLHVMQANLLAIQVRWIDHVITHPLWGVYTLLRASLGLRGRFLWRVGAAANLIGRNVDIHPTARVEGSILGDGVTIGPQALVRGAIIGAGSTLEQRADVCFSVLGQRCFVSKHSIAWATVAMDGAELCMKGMQMCLVGKDASLTARATPMDAQPGHTIRVRDGAALVDSKLPILGVCFGHRCFVGADIYVAPGREVPNGLKLYPDPNRILARVPEELDLARVYTVRGGTLVPLGE